MFACLCGSFAGQFRVGGLSQNSILRVVFGALIDFGSVAGSGITAMGRSPMCYASKDRGAMKTLEVLETIPRQKAIGYVISAIEHVEQKQ